MVRNLTESEKKDNDDIIAVGSVVRSPNHPMVNGNFNQNKPNLARFGGNRPKNGEKKPKVGEKCHHCHFFMEYNTTIDNHFCRKAAQYVGPNQHCNICDMDFESTPKTFRHIMKDHFDVALGLEEGNER